MTVGTLALVSIAPAVSAESPLEVAEELLTDGVYIAPARGDVDDDGLAEAVQRARARGLTLVIVAPSDPEPDPAAFARRIQEAADADAALVFTRDGGIEANVIDEFESARLRALGAARSKAMPLAAVDAFTDELLTEPSRSLPPIVGQLITVVVGLAVVLTVAVMIEQSLRRLKRGRRQRQQERHQRTGSAA